MGGDTRDGGFFPVYLALFLVNNDIDSARHLWRRTPNYIKTEVIDYKPLWEIGKLLWQRNLAGAYLAMAAHKWSDQVQMLVNQLKSSTKQTTMSLISKAYSQISIDNLCVALALSREELLLGNI